MNTPFFSVIIPTYNRELLLPRAINSVLNQTFKNFEIIIVDDGSNDGTPYLISKYLARYRNIIYLYQENKGVGPAKNKGIAVANGDWIALLDSDDEYTPDHLQLRYDFIKGNQSLDFMYGSMEVIGDDFVVDKDNPNKLIPISETSMGSTSVARKTLYKKVGGYGDVYGEDGDFLDRVKASKSNVAKLDYKTYRYYRGLPDSITEIARNKIKN